MKIKYKRIPIILLFIAAVCGVSLVLYSKSKKDVFDSSDPQIEEVCSVSLLSNESENTFDNVEPLIEEVDDNEKSLQLHVISGDKDSVFCAIEQSIFCYIDSANYSYEAWRAKTEKLYGTATCTHDNDYDYLNHKCNILDYLNWHLINKISHYENKALMDGIEASIEMTKSLYSLQDKLIGMIFDNENTIYDGYGLSLEFKNIINDNLVDLYSTLSDRKIEKRKITQTDVYPYECPAISDDIIDMVYQRFITEYIQNLDCQIRDLIHSNGILSDELAMWKSFMTQRLKVENSLSGKIKDAWAYNTKVWKLNRIRQLKNEFSCYGTMSELDYTLSLQDCNYTELMNYHSFSKAWDVYEKEHSN